MERKKKHQRRDLVFSRDWKKTSGGCFSLRSPRLPEERRDAVAPHVTHRDEDAPGVRVDLVEVVATPKVVQNPGLVEVVQLYHVLQRIGNDNVSKSKGKKRLRRAKA